jgi:hypothetical protein
MNSVRTFDTFREDNSFGLSDFQSPGRQFRHFIAV